ncbi:DUF1684 domain-containing protein [Leeuwenhoekiella sp. W20_SRS_FM14]|uniref:DUF1684 domain-containing protein n=1 Tax=Leeuwenhoekiella sp. W20_SRS_FM14 TaxID=3240270 RepID=UPI003F9A20AD
MRIKTFTMIKTALYIALLIIYCGNLNAQTDYEKEILIFQSDLNAEYKNPEESPLTLEEIEQFTTHTFYPIDENYRVKASFERIANPITIDFQTSSGVVKKYDTYALAKFELFGKPYQLTVYQSQSLREIPEYKEYLFLPITDYTSGLETYGAGRYIDLRIPEGDTIIIDFNKAYNPFCAYSPNYSCPIPPENNDLKIEIKAGVMSPVGHK